LLPLFEEGELAGVDTVSLGYLESGRLARGRRGEEEFLSAWFDGEPLLTGVKELPWGRIGMVLLPCWDHQLYSEGALVVDLITRARDLAGRLGARTVSLTGLLASATNYGLAVPDLPGAPALTTGHATTCAAVLLSVERILAEAGEELGAQQVAFLGLGSVGTHTFRGLLERPDAPAGLLLCDLETRRPHLELLRDEARQRGFTGAIEVVTTRGPAPEALYRADLIVGATNVPDVLAVDRLRPGTKIVDDSGPHCFQAAAAFHRAEESRDLLFTEGGMLEAPQDIEELVYLPDRAREGMSKEETADFLGRQPRNITSCVLSGLLSARFDDFPTTLGPFALDTTLQHHRRLSELGFTAAPLLCEGRLLAEDVIANFRSRRNAP
jgi:hypothetical protein